MAVRPAPFVSILFASLVALAGTAQAQVYFRLDTGGSISAGADLKDKNFARDRAICGDPACGSPGKIDDVGSSPLIGGGIGWRFNPSLRADATFTYRGGYSIDQGLPNGATYKADVTSSNLMLNGYYDVTVGWGRPYVGAGIGWASNKIDKLRATNAGFTFDLPGGTKANFAWAVTAGIGVPIQPGITLDVGYRYVELGKMETDFGNVTFNGTPLATYEGMTGKLRAHELTVGLRF